MFLAPWESELLEKKYHKTKARAAWGNTREPEPLRKTVRSRSHLKIILLPSPDQWSWTMVNSLNGQC